MDTNNNRPTVKWVKRSAQARALGISDAELQRLRDLDRQAFIQASMPTGPLKRNK
jgi:hypothetical protein